MCDSSKVRRTFHQRRLTMEYGIAPVPVYGDFNSMLVEQKPDVVIVCTPDYLHHESTAGATIFSKNKCSQQIPRPTFSSAMPDLSREQPHFWSEWRPNKSMAAGCLVRILDLCNLQPEAFQLHELV